MSASVDPLVQLQQAAVMAMQHMPEQMLPKVLDTAVTLFMNDRKNVGFSRFTTQLLLDILAHEKVPSIEKPFIVRQSMAALWEMAETKDAITFKNCILCLGNIYDQLFDLVAKTSDEKLWSMLLKFKDLVITTWKTCYPLDISENDFSAHSRGTGVKLASTRFVSKIIIVHTSGPGISIGSVPDTHPVISNKPALEAEAKVLLDKLLTFLIEEPMMCAPWFTGILNCLSFIMKQRPMATIRIASGLLKFNIDLKFQEDNESVLKFRLSKRFVERCYRNLVQFGTKNQLIKNSGSMAQYRNKLVKISQTLFIIGEETKAKGILNFEPAAVEHKMTPADKKRYTRSKDAEQSPDSSSAASSATIKSPSPSHTPLVSPPMGNTMMNATGTVPLMNSFQPPLAPQSQPHIVKRQPPPDLPVLQALQSYAFTKSTTKHPHFLNPAHTAVDNSYSAVFALMNPVSSGFDVSGLSQDTMAKLCTEALSNTDTGTAINGLSIVASRYTDLINKWLQNNAQSVPVVNVNTAQITNNGTTVKTEPSLDQVHEAAPEPAPEPATQPAQPAQPAQPSQPAQPVTQHQETDQPQSQTTAQAPIQNDTLQAASATKRSREDEPDPPIKQEVTVKKEESEPLPSGENAEPERAGSVQPPQSKRVKLEKEEIPESASTANFSLAAPKLTEEEKLAHLQRIVQNVLSIPTQDSANAPISQTQDTNPLDKVLLMKWDNKASWVYLVTRLCTRGVSANPEMRKVVTNAIFDYFCDDFQNRITLVLEWLSEEWYHEDLISEGKEHTSYNEWSLKVLDFMIPKLEDSHRRLFIRMVSELPLLTQDHIDKMKSLCLDPTRSVLGFQSLKFMLMFRPPVKPYIKIALEAMSQIDESIKAQCDSLLQKYWGNAS